MQEIPNLYEVLEFAKHNHGQRGDVIGINVGSKFQDGIRRANFSCVQFYVTEKKDLAELKNPLPRFVYGRKNDGTLDYSVKVPTDVIALKNLKLCGKSGSNVSGNGDSGTVALFVADADDPNRTIAITCSHVVSHLDAQVDRSILFSGGTGDTYMEARVLWNSTLNEGAVLAFDLAYLDVVFEIPPITPRTVSGVANVLNGTLPSAHVQREMVFQAALQNNQAINLTVDSMLTSVEGIDATDSTGNTTKVTVDNLFLCKSEAGVDKGDSGSLVHNGQSIVGIIVAKADDGFVLFHPMEDILELGFDASGIRVQLS